MPCADRVVAAAKLCLLWLSPGNYNFGRWCCSPFSLLLVGWGIRHGHFYVLLHSLSLHFLSLGGGRFQLSTCMQASDIFLSFFFTKMSGVQASSVQYLPQLSGCFNCDSFL